jgi:hypothetical protein
MNSPPLPRQFAKNGVLTLHTVQMPGESLLADGTDVRVSSLCYSAPTARSCQLETYSEEFGLCVYVNTCKMIMSASYVDSRKTVWLMLWVRPSL